MNGVILGWYIGLIAFVGLVAVLAVVTGRIGDRNPPRAIYWTVAAIFCFGGALLGWLLA